MAATPPPVALRAHTPPTPLHGARYDTYEPYSPRRSKRSTAHSNPYSSFNGERSPTTSFQRHTTPPPTTSKRARFARAPTQLSSPPSSPASPRTQKVNLHKTPRKNSRGGKASISNFTAVFSDSDNAGPSSQATTLAPTIDPITMLPTPSKTPTNKKRPAAAINSTARILSFQPNHPNDAMPSPRRLKKSSHQHHRGLASRAGFELYEDDINGLDGTSEGDIQIYTDANARVPVLDESEDNPFVGPKRSSAARPQRRKQRTRADDEMDAKVGRGEGVVYVFRGKKIFRAFADEDANGAGGEAEEEEACAPDQRRLRHQAGSAAQRPLTRSAIKPRLLFPSTEQRREREGEGEGDDVDEEAVTDIEMDVAPASALSNGDGDESLVSPPPTHKKKRTINVPLDGTPDAMEEEGEPMNLGTDASFSSASSAGKKGKGKSPFDEWQRTKSSRKRAGEAVEEGAAGVAGVKRTRSGVGGSML